MTSLTIEVVPAYRLAERIEHWPLGDVLERWDELFAGHRHFSFFWLPSEAVGRALRARDAARAPNDGHLLRQASTTRPATMLPDCATSATEVDRATASIPPSSRPTSTSSSTSCRSSAGARLEAMRELMLASQPAAVFPMEVRTVAADEAYLSSNYGTPTTVISVSGMPGTDYGPTCARSTGYSVSSARACTGASSTS